MRFLLKMAVGFAGKPQMKIDPDIPLSYLLRECRSYGFRLLRGFMAMPLLGEHGRRLFLGRRVKLIQKKRIRMGGGVALFDGCLINALSREGVTLGDSVHLGKNTVIECTGSLSSIGKGLRIGHRSTFGSDCFFGAAGGIEIGDDVIAGQNIRFHSENHVFIDINTPIRLQGVTHKGITVGSNCWIGAGAVFLDGARVGDGCVIGANSVVRGNIPDYSVAAGCPARVLRSRIN